MLRRDAEALPASDAMAERRRAGHGLVRPELAVLLAYAKRSLTDALLHSALPEDPHFARDLRSYFPRAVVERFGELIDEHPLRRELVATIVANDVVNALGPTAVSGLARELGCDAAQVVRAYRIAREVCGATQRWLEVEGTEADVSHDVIWRLMAGVDELVGDLTRWYLLHAPAGDLDTIIAAAHGPFVELADMLGDLRSDAWRQERDAIVAELVDAGVDPDVARRHAYQPALVYGPDIISVAQTTGREIEDVARAFFAIGEGLRLEWLERECDALPATSRIQRWAVQALRDEILSARRVLAQRALEEAPEGGGEEAVQRFLESCAESRRRLGGVARVLAVEGDAGLAGLTVAVRHLRALTGQVV
jgi:glutamate dehydrogenase